MRRLSLKSGCWMLAFFLVLFSAASGAETEEIERGRGGEPSAVIPGKRLFSPLIADPRWPHFSASYQYYMDDEELESVGATSFGETFGIFRGDNFLNGLWQLNIQAGVFAIFNLDADSNDLVNADYWVGFPFSCRWDGFSTIFRIFHQSSHLGDEYLLRNRVDRVNLSYEALDLKLSYEPWKWLRVYGGGGYLIRHEPDDLEPASLQYGLELRSPQTWMGRHVRPLIGVDIQEWEENDWDSDISIRGGLQFEGQEGGAGSRFQIMIEYYTGNSPHGQFYERDIESLGIGIHYYF